ncbi:unnamed protein product [Clavelina lepadiformis]|uniref:chitinase n=1 Tax=Clavelina lepadiformis TaxID=159417 RepID=A0ABP0GS01_CLALP
MLKGILILLCAGLSYAALEYPQVATSEFDCSLYPNVDRFYAAYPITGECEHFYRCVPTEPLAYKYECLDAETVFDEHQQYCVFPYQTSPPCGTLGSTTIGTGGTNLPPATADPNGFYCDGLAFGYYANPAECNSFYICNGDVPAGTSPNSVPCPSGLVYNPVAEYCDWPYNVAPPCGTKTFRRVPFDNVGPACPDDERYECNGVTNIVVDSDCTTYYNCDENIQRVCPSSCPPGLVFNAANGYCDWVYNVASPCGTLSARQVYETVTGPACEPEERYNCNGATATVVDSEDCSVFYNCDSNIQQPCPSKCADGLVYNTDLGVCDWLYNVPPPCGVTTTTIATTSVVITNNPGCSDSERYNCNGAVAPVRDSADCSVYYNCDAQTQHPCPTTCPDGLLYDETLDVCNWPSEVTNC